MEWIQFVIFFIGVFGLFIWNRAEARQDARHMDSKLESNKALVAAMLEGIRQEMRDFHGRLCAIEEKRGK